MVAYCRIATECRSSILGQGSSSTARDFSDFRVVEWRRNLPYFLRFNGDRAEFNPATEPRSQYRLRLLLYLRANQMRIVIRRHSAFQSGPRDVDTSSMQTVIEVACDTIRVLVTMARTSDVYQAQQKTFNHFLESALSSILLFVGHRKDAGEPSCSEELHMAMGLVRGLAAKSWMMRKLCDKLEKLKVVQAALNSRTQRSTAFTASDSSSPKESRGNQPAVDRRESASDMDVHMTAGSRSDEVDPLPTAAFTPVSDSLSTSRHGDSETIQFAGRDDDINLLDIDPEPTYTAVMRTPQSGRAELAPMTNDSGFQRITEASYPSQPPLTMESSPSFGESGVIVRSAAKDQVGNLDTFPYIFFADMQDFLNVQDNIFTF